MNNYFKSLAIMLATALLIFAAACSGGGGSSSSGGSGGGGGTPAGTFTKEVALTESISSHSGMFANTDTFRHYQLLYKPAYIAGSGFIKSICFKYSVTGSLAVTCSNITIKLGHTNMEDLDSDMTQNIVNKGSAVTVLNDATITIPAGTEGNYFEIPLSTEFNYNGVDNLVIDVTRREATSPDYIGIPTGRGETNYTARVYSESIATPDTATSSSLYVFHTKFVFAGGDNKAASAEKLGDYSIGITPGYTGRTQMLILASDINGSGLITGMAINPSTTATGAANVTGMNVKIAHIPSGTTALSSAVFSENYGGAVPVTVTSDLSYQVPAGQPSAVWIPFNANSFTYDGTSNLLVDISCTIASGHYSVTYVSFLSGTNRVIYANDPDETTGTFRNRAFEPVFRFYGGTVNVVAPDAYGDGIYYPFHNTDDNTLQYLYSAAELGIKGSISKISLRLYSNDSTASNYNNFTVIIGQSDNIILGDTLFSANLSGAQTVYNGIFTVTGGLVKGDWIEIPLSAPFACDSTKNLVVQFSSSHGTAINSIVREPDDTRYLNRQAHADNTSGTIDGRNNCLADIKLEVK